MNPESLLSYLGALGAAWPLALTMAVALAGDRAREGRRRRRMNERLHELRRPLQALALAARSHAAEGPDPLELALAALRDLDREVNGGELELRRRPVEARMLAIAAAERWRAKVASAGRRIAVRWRCGDEIADVDPVRVAQALDNLIANALEHGSGEITIEGASHRGSIDLIVRDRGAAMRSARPRRESDPRRGHGLRITRAVAERSGGALRLAARPRGGTAAALVLPLASKRGEPAGFPGRR